ncbi:MAG: hypothetical protein AAB037_01920, partial [Chloroflexota bacterium]
MRKSIIPSIIVLLATLIDANAQHLYVGNLSGEPLKIDPNANYYEINMVNFEPAKPAEPGLWARLFANRKKYGVGYIIIQADGQEPQKTLVFDYEQESKDRYRYNSIGISPEVSYSLIDRFIFPPEKPLTLQVVVKNWEDAENIAVIQKLIGVVRTSPASEHAAREATVMEI